MGGFALSEARGVLPSVGRPPAAGQTSCSTADSHWERPCECKECRKVGDGSAFVQNNFPRPRESLQVQNMWAKPFVSAVFSLIM